MRIDTTKSPSEWTPAEVECLIDNYNEACRLVGLWRSKYEGRHARLEETQKRCGRTQQHLGAAVERAVTAERMILRARIALKGFINSRAEKDQKLARDLLDMLQLPTY
jgi:hypothetical protein